MHCKHCGQTFTRGPGVELTRTQWRLFYFIKRHPKGVKIQDVKKFLNLETTGARSHVTFFARRMKSSELWKLESKPYRLIKLQKRPLPL